MQAQISLNANNAIAPVDDRLYSSFIEHMGRAIYTGIYEPTHPTADEYGFRKDVQELVKPLQLSYIRYPGGNFLSGYRWLDGVGPKENRPVRPDLAWYALEPNLVGTDEFLQWCERVGVKPMIAVNLGTGTPQSAVDLLEYVNGTEHTYYADMRRKNGHEEPYNVKLWCLGNEMDNPKQLCGKTPEEYARVAVETAKMMKRFDPTIELVACGSYKRESPLFGQWERTVLKHCYNYIDYISLHQYYKNLDGDRASFLARTMEMDEFIHIVNGICREAKAEHNSNKDMYLSFDEWNVWYHYRMAGKQAPKWQVGRPIDEEDYNTEDALVVGCMMNTLIRNADTVKIACLAQLINALAAIMTEPGGKAWVNTIYWPFLYASRYGRGTSLRPEVICGTYDCAVRKDVPLVDCSAVANEDGVTLYAVNRGAKAMECQIGLNGFAGVKSVMHAVYDETTEKPVEKDLGVADTVTLPPYSWNMVRVSF